MCAMANEEARIVPFPRGTLLPFEGRAEYTHRWKKACTYIAGFEPATFWLTAQHFNHKATSALVSSRGFSLSYIMVHTRWWCNVLFINNNSVSPYIKQCILFLKYVKNQQHTVFSVCYSMTIGTTFSYSYN